MESIFLLLSGLVLAAGVLYWFWSHIQLTQKKVQLLENAVFELRGMLTGSPHGSMQGQMQGSPQGSPQGQTQVPAPVYNDLDDEEWDSAPSEQPVASTPLEHLHNDLQPGGRIEVPVEEKEVDNTLQFRELFLQHEERKPAPKETASSLDAMPVRELRRLAEQRGITGTADMKKKELVAALRQLATPKEEKTVELVLETTEAEAEAETVPTLE